MKAEQKAADQKWTEQVLKDILSSGTIDVRLLNKKSSYLITVELNDTPKDKMYEYCFGLVYKLRRQLHIKHCVVLPIVDGKPLINFYEIKDKKPSEAK